MKGFVLAMLIVSLGVAPAIGKDDHKEKHDNGHYDHKGRGYDHGHYVQGRNVHHTTVYEERVYVAPPVVYAPPPSPGISIFFPPIFIH